MPRSSSGSPARKRQRLSSPTYDDQVGELTQEDLAAFDAINVQLSQALHSGKPQEPGSSQPHRPSASFIGSSFAKASSLHDDADNPFKNKVISVENRPKLTIPPIAFASASSFLAQDYTRSPSPEEPPEESKFDDWFKPTSADIIPSFQIPKISSGSGVLGFSTASNRGIILPSEEALAKAQARLDAWNREEEERIKEAELENIRPPSASASALSNIGFKPAKNSPLAASPMRTAFQPVSNIMDTPETPSPVGFSRPLVNRTSTNNATPNTSYRPKQFKPPMLRQPHTPSSGSNVGSPLNPRRNTPSLGFSSAASQSVPVHPLAAAPITAPQFTLAHPSSSFVTPLRAKPTTKITRTTPAPFKTPFKSGMRPPLVLSVPGKSSQPRSAALVKDRPTQERPAWNPPTRKSFFSMTSPIERKTLVTSGLRPQQHEDYELEDMGINVAMLNQITPETALYYNFHTTASSPQPSISSTPPPTLGPTEALEELLQRGCDLATKPWVDNHWCLILWKLAGMVALDPEKEARPNEARWCWLEVIRQLLYRYERELNGGTRPPLRKIANQDAPAAFPMVLCISNIFWSPAGVTEDGLSVISHPELELTDGWYRLRAQVDLPMARAVRKGIIKIGRKIGIAGARLSTEKKDATEILEAYNSTFLVLSGNSSHLMPWHTKLGFTQGPCISTLHSLTADGGIVAALDFVIIKPHPIAYLEFIEDENGNKERIGPRNEVEELQVNQLWKRRRETEASKLREQYEKKFARFEGYVDRLERKAGSQLQNIKGCDSYPPDHIDSLYDELEYPDTAGNLLARISSIDAAWLSLHARRQTEKARELVGEEMEKELQTTCPPREVRSFRVLIVQDTRAHRRPANRNAQLTVWDVTNLTLDEGSNAGSFEPGQRFMATNLMPQQPKAWMDCAPGSEVFLSTRRDTRWTKIKTVLPA